MGVKLASELVVVTNSQQEFWAREFGAVIIEKDESFISVIKNLVGQQIRPVVQLDKNYAELRALEALPENSIIGWCHSDETFDLAFNTALTNLNSLHTILRPYHLEKTTFTNSIKSLSYTFLNLRMSTSLKDVLRIIAWQFRGLGMQIRQHKILKKYAKARRQFRNIPIGYTNVFALSLLAFIQRGIEPRESILSLEPGLINHIQSGVNFVGQSGQIVRELSIRSLEKSELGQVIRRSGYGASNVIDQSVATLGKEYVELLHDSLFVLCPPGNISGQTFRYFEVITLGRIPLVMNHVTSDPNFKSGYWYGKFLSSAGSWRKMLHDSQGLSHKEISIVIEKNAEFMKKEMRSLKEFLLNVVSVFPQEHK